MVKDWTNIVYWYLVFPVKALVMACIFIPLIPICLILDLAESLNHKLRREGWKC